MSDSPIAPLGATLQRLYFVRFAFAVVWAALLLAIATTPGPLLTALLVLYPLGDAVAVLVQLRADGPSRGRRAPEWINVAASIIAAVGLAWASTVSVAGVLAVWGAWAIVSGIVQLVTAVVRRSLGGQVPLIVSGGLSVLAGSAFIIQSLSQANSAAGVGGYAILGGIFFLIAGIRITLLRRRTR